MFDLFTRKIYQSVKTASLSPCCGDGGGEGWIEKFKGTPLFDQALELAQMEIQQEAQRLQESQMHRASYDSEDQLRLKKKLLELELARQGMVPSANPMPESPEGMDVPTAPGTGAPGTATQPNITMSNTPEKMASARFLFALESMIQKEAVDATGLGSAAWKFIRKNPGLAAGAGIGAVGGGLRGAQQKIDPVTGQPVGGGVTGAITGALGGTVLGGVGGLAAQGAIRTGLGAKKVVDNYAKKGLQAPGGYLGQLKDQALWRSHALGKDVQRLGQGANNSLQGGMNTLRDWRKESIVARGAPKPLEVPATPKVEPPAG